MAVDEHEHFFSCDKWPECSWLTFEKLKWNLPTEFCGLVLFFLVRWIGVDLFCVELSVATMLLTHLYSSQALSRNSSVFRPISIGLTLDVFSLMNTNLLSSGCVEIQC